MVHVARAQLVGALVVLVVGIAGGVMMQIELADPGGRWSPQFYARMLALHDLSMLAIGPAVLAGVLGYAAVTKLVGATRTPMPVFGWVAFGLWVIGLAVSIVVQLLHDDSGWTFYTPYSLQDGSMQLSRVAAPLAFAGAALIYAVHLGMIVAAHARASLPVAVAAGLVIALGGAGVLGITRAFDSIQGLYPTAFAATAGLILGSVALGGDRKVQHLLVAVACGLAAVCAVFPTVVVAIPLAAIWTALAIIGGFARPAVAFIVFGAAPAVVFHSLAYSVLRNPGVDLHLHDTHYVIAALHLISATLAFTGIAGVQAWPVFGRASNPVLAWIGGCLCSAGMIVHAFAQLRAGSEGMPRRYWDYDPMHEPTHDLALKGSVAVIVGAVIVVVAWIVGRRERDGR